MGDVESCQCLLKIDHCVPAFLVAGIVLAFTAFCLRFVYVFTR